MLTSIAGRSVIVVSRHLEEAEACARELRDAGGDAKGHAADVTKMGDMQTLAETAATLHGGIDVVCANAGIFPQARIEDLSPDRFCPRASTRSHRRNRETLRLVAT